MKKNRIVFFIGVIILLAIGLFFWPGKRNTESVMRIGWQSAWATQGQLAEVLQKTNILSLNNIKGEFKSFSYGAPLSEAALAGELDVVFVGDQPAITLLSKSSDWKIIGRLMDFRVGVVVPQNSKIQSISDLNGKTLGIPFGSSTHRVALQMLKESGIEPDKSIKILNLDIQEQNEIVKAGGQNIWNGVDAFASWDHHIANYEKQNWAKVISSKTALGVVMMSENYIKAHPSAVEDFLASFKIAYYYYSQNQDQANKWFANDAGGKFDIDILNKVASIESNMFAKNLDDIHIEISKDQMKLLQEAAEFALQNKLIKNQVNILNSVITYPKNVESIAQKTSLSQIKSGN